VGRGRTYAIVLKMHQRIRADLLQPHHNLRCYPRLVLPAPGKAEFMRRPNHYIRTKTGMLRTAAIPETYLESLAGPRIGFGIQALAIRVRPKPMQHGGGIRPGMPYGGYGGLKGGLDGDAVGRHSCTIDFDPKIKIYLLCDVIYKSQVIRP